MRSAGRSGDRRGQGRLTVFKQPRSLLFLSHTIVMLMPLNCHPASAELCFQLWASSSHFLWHVSGEGIADLRICSAGTSSYSAGM